MEIGLEFICTK